MGKKKGKAEVVKPLPQDVIDAMRVLQEDGDSHSAEERVIALRCLGQVTCGWDIYRMDVAKEAFFIKLLATVASEGTPNEVEATGYLLRCLAAGNFLQTAYDNPTAILNAGLAKPLTHA